MKEFFKKIFSKESLKKFFHTYIWLMVILFVVDIVTKWAVVKHFGVEAMTEGVRTYSDGAIEIIKDFCYIGGSINNGAAFSMLAGKRVLLLLISLVMSAAFIVFYVLQYKKLNATFKVALALMITGGVGNLIDRAFYWESTVGFGGVIDWIQFYFWGWPFAMFNIADSCLVIGIIIVLIAMLIDEAKEAKKKAKRGEFKYSPEQIEKMKKEEESNEGNKGQ